MKSTSAKRRYVPGDRGLRVLAALVLSLLAVAVLLCRHWDRGLPVGSFSQTFDALAWRSDADPMSARGARGPRQRMVGALVSRLDPTMGRAQVEDLLGRPDGRRRPGDFPGGGDTEPVHVPGRERELALFPGFDAEVLILGFDDRDRLVRWRVGRS